MRHEDTTICSCPPGSDNGTFIKKITVNENTELWGACARTTSDYDFDCNHAMVSTGNHVFFPSESVKMYNDKEQHIHYKLRLNTPHSAEGDKWQELKLTTCKCDVSPQHIFTSELFSSSALLEDSLDAK